MPRAPAQNFGACLELAKKKSRKAYGEKKEAFNTLKGLSGRYIYAAEAASEGTDVFDHFMLTLEKVYNVPRVAALRKLVPSAKTGSSGGVGSSSDGVDGEDEAGGDEGGGGGGGGGGDGDGERASGKAKAAGAAAELAPIDDVLLSADGVYDVTRENIAAFKTHWGKSILDSAGTEFTDVRADHLFDKFEEWLLERMPPANVQYPLREEDRSFFKLLDSISRTRKGEHSAVATAKAHLARDKAAVEFHNKAVKRKLGE